MTMYPIVPDYQKYPGSAAAPRTPTARSASAAHWIKTVLHFMFIYKAKAKPGWFLIPE